MPDILFRCPNCSKSLAIDSACAGQSVKCVDCGCAQVVPEADIEFRCLHCQKRLSSPTNMSGSTISCPGCEKEVTIPSHTSRLSLGQKRVASGEPSARRCPKCNSEVAPAAILCVNCGIDLRTGEPFHKKPKPMALNSTWIYLVISAVLLVVALGGWHIRNINQKEKANRIAQLQARAAQAEREAKEQAERLKAEADRMQAEADKKKAEAERLRAEAEANRLLAVQEKYEAEQRKMRMTALQERFLNDPEVGLLDALAQISLQQKLRVAIDPDIMGVVGGIRVKTADLDILADPGNRNDWLSRQGFVMRSCPISDKDTNRVNLLTTGPIWSYSCANQQLRNGDYATAIKSLEAVRADDSEFGAHCLSLRNLLHGFVAQQMEANELAVKVRRNLSSCGTHLKAAQMFTRGAEMAGSQDDSKRLGDRRVQEAMAKSNYNKALEFIRVVCADLEAFKRKTIASSSDLASRYDMAFDANLHTEAKFLVDAYIDAYSSLRGLYAEVEKTGLLTDVKTADFYGMRAALNQVAGDARAFGTDMVDVPEELRRTSASIDKWVRVSSDQAGVVYLEGTARTDISRELEASSRALLYDRGNILARAAAGFYRMRLHESAMQVLLKNEGADRRRFQALAREFDTCRKSGLLHAVTAVSGQLAQAQLSANENDKVGSVSGLCIFGWDSAGQIMKITVQIQPRSRKTLTLDTNVRSSTGVVTPFAGYWRNWSVSERYVYETISDPIVFEDYGPKDDQMTISAIESYKWLSKTFPTNMNDQAVHIAFHYLKEGKRGDSAGAAIALAAYSSIQKIPVRADVAITGSIRSDGSILGVGGIFEKIRGCVSAPGVEVIIIPTENEGDAMLVPLDDLCRITVISAADMATYLKYATQRDYRRSAIETLHKAQVHLLAGQSDIAASLLLEVVAECPENFTARRLLELIAFCRRTAKTGLASAKAM